MITLAIKRYQRPDLSRNTVNLRVPMTSNACFKAAGGLALLGLFLFMIDQ